MKYTVAALLLLLVLCIGFYWRLTLTNQYVWFDHPDMAYLELPRLAFEAREIQAGRLPLWNSHLWAGQPLIGGTQPGPLYPFNLLFCLLPFKDSYIDFRWLNLYYVFIHLQAAVAACWLARELGRSHRASLLAGCLFAFGGFVGSVAWLDVMNGAVWTPLMLLFALRAARGERPLGSAALGGLALGMAWLSGTMNFRCWPAMQWLSSGYGRSFAPGAPPLASPRPRVFSSASQFSPARRSYCRLSSMAASLCAG